MTQPTNTQSLSSKIDLLVNKAENDAATLDQQQLMDLREDELNDLKTKIAESKLELLKKQETLTIIGKQQELLRLKTQLAKNAKTAPNTPSIQETKTTTQTGEERRAKTFWNPSTWTPEERMRAATIGIAGGMVIGGIILWQAFRKKTSEVAKAVKEKTSSAWRTIKFLTIGGLVAAGAYFGIRSFTKLSDFINKSIQLQKKIEEMQKKLKELKDAPEAVRAKLELEIQEAKEALKKIQEDKNIKDLVEKEKQKAKETAPIETEKKSIEKKEMQTLVNKGAAYIVMMFDENAAGWAFGPKSKVSQIQDVINDYSPQSFKHGNKKMSTILSPNFTFEVDTQDRTNRTKAAERVHSFCVNNYDNVMESLMKRGKNLEQAEQEINAMSLPDYLKVAIANYGGIADIVQTVGDKSGDMVEKLKHVDLGKLEGIHREVEAQLHITLEQGLNLTPEELGEFDYLEFLKTFAGTIGGGTARSTVLPLEDTMEHRAAAYILENLQTGTTHKYMLPCFHGVLPSDAEMRGKTDEQKVQICLLDRMPVSQAIRCYFYGEMIKSGNPAGMALMQVEVLKFIHDSEKNFFDKLQKYDVMQAIAEKALTQTPQQLAEEWKKMDVTIDPAVLDKASKLLSGTVSFIGGEVVGRGWDASLETLAALLAIVWNNKVLIGGTGLAASGMVTAGKYIGGVDTEHFGKALADWASDVRVNNIYRRTANTLNILGPGKHAIKDAAHQYLVINETMAKLSSIDEEVHWLFQSCTASSRNAAQWSQLSKELSQKGFVDAAHAADAIANSKDMQRVIYTQRYLKGGGWRGVALRPFHWVNHRVIASGTKFAIEKSAEGMSLIRNSTFFKEALRRSGVGAEAMLKMMQNLEMPTWLAEAFAKSARGMEMFCNAAKSGGAPALEYLAKLGSYAKVSGKVIGGAAVGIDVIICAIEMAANKARIAQEDNEAIKELFAMRDKISVTGAVIGTAFSGTLFASAWAPAAVPFATALSLPLVGIFVTKYAHDELEAVSQTWLSEERDWAKKSEGSLLNDLDKLGPGKVTFWQNLAAGNSRIETFHHWDTMSKAEFAAWQKHALALPEKANEGQRFLATRAYVAKNTDIYPLEGETQEAFRERFTEYQRLQIAYLGKITQGSFDSKYMDSYRNAASHAELITLSRTLKAAGQSQMLDVHGKKVDIAHYEDISKKQQDSIEQSKIIAAYQKQSRAVTLLQLNVFKQMENSKNATTDIQDQLLQTALLQEVRHDINLCEKNIQNADFSGWQMTGYEENTRNIARFVMNNELRILVREQADRLRTMEIASVEDFEKSLQTIRAFLQKNPLSFEANAKKYLNNGTSGMARDLEEANKSLQELTGNKNAKAGPDIFSDYRYIRSKLYLHPTSKRTQTAI